MPITVGNVGHFFYFAGFFLFCTFVFEIVVYKNIYVRICVCTFLISCKIIKQQQKQQQ